MNEPEMTPAEFQELVDTGQIKIRQLTPKEREELWQKKVLEHYRFTCANCGSDDHVSARMVVPTEAGGKLSVSNGTTVCRICVAASKAVNKAHELGREERAPVNVYISQRLYDLVSQSVESHRGFNSMAVMIRHLVGEYVVHERNFEDLENWQDEGLDVKINFLVPAPQYEVFKAKTTANGLTVTQAIQGLLTWYVMKADPVVQEAARTAAEENASIEVLPDTKEVG